MPQLQNIILTDRASTPVNHTFVPRDIENGVATVVETSGVPIGNNTLSISMRKNGAGKYRGTLRTAFPVVQTQTINGVASPVVVRTAYVETTVTFDERSTQQERADAIGMHESALLASKVLVNDTFVKLEGIY